MVDCRSMQKYGLKYVKVLKYGCGIKLGYHKWMVIHQWIGLRENLQETRDFPIKHGVFLYIFP